MASPLSDHSQPACSGRGFSETGIFDGLRCLVVALAGCFALCFAVSQPALAERLIARTDADGDGNFIAQQLTVGRLNNAVVTSAPVTLNAPLPSGATVDRILLANGGRHAVYGAFTGDAAIFDDLFVVDLNTPGTAVLLNGDRQPGIEAPLIFAAVNGSANVPYALRNFSTGTDRLFVVSTENPGAARIVFDALPTGATVGDMELSPDGQALVYRVDLPGSESQLWLSFLGLGLGLGQAQNGQRIDAPAPSANYQPNEFQFSPDSRYFLWRGKQSVPGQAEPLRAVTIDSARRTVSSPVQINPGAVQNEQVFEFEVGPDSQRVYYRAIAGNSSLPGDTFVAQLEQPGTSVQLNPAPPPGAGFTAQEDLLVLGNRVLYNSAQTRPDLVDLYSVPTDGGVASTPLSGSLQLNQVSLSSSQPGVSHMVASADETWVALIDGDPAQTLFVLDPLDAERNFAPFDLTALGHTIEQSSRTNRTRRDPFRFSTDSQFLAIPADPQNFDPEVDPPDLGAELLVGLPDVDGSGRAVFATGGPVAGFRWLADRTALAASALPASRSGQVGATLTAFVATINGGDVPARACRISLNSEVPLAFGYQRTNSQTNAVEGVANTPQDIAAGALQTWVVSAEVLAAFPPTEVQLRVACDNSDSVPAIAGVNTLLLSGSTNLVPDLVALASTPNQNGILDLPDPARGGSGAGAFSVASINVGGASDLLVEVDSSGVDLPVALSICETNASGACTNPSTATSGPVSLNVIGGATNSFSVFATATGAIPENAASNRLRVLFREPDGTIRGKTSVALRTVLP